MSDARHCLLPGFRKFEECQLPASCHLRGGNKELFDALSKSPPASPSHLEIEIRGLRGAGKTTALDAIATALVRAGFSVTLFDDDEHRVVGHTRNTRHVTIRTKESE